MSRRHFASQPGNDEKFNIITGNPDNQPNTTPRYEKLSSQAKGSVFASDNDDSTSRFQTTSGQIGTQSQNRSNIPQQVQETPYYGRQKKTNEFYAKTGVFSAQGSEDHPLGKNVDTSVRPQQQQNNAEGTKYSRYY